MTLSNNNILGKSLLAVVVGAGLSFSAASAVIVFDPADTTAVNPFVSASLGSGVTVTGSNVQIVLPAGGDVDPNVAGWNGNEYTYLNQNPATPVVGFVTYEAASGDYFTDFSAQIIVHEGNIGSTASDALTRFTFESSTDGSAWSTFSVTGVAAGLSGAGIDDWNHVNVSTTALAGLTDITHLRITMTEKASGGEHWHQQLGSATVEVVPEPSSFALLAGMFGLTWVMLRRRA